MVTRILMRGGRVVIPRSLQADILALAHEGHPGMASMLGQMREAVWWPGMTSDVGEYMKTCNLGCAAAVPRTTTPPMTEKKTPDRPWQHCSADYKGPIGGKYYFHVLIDNYSQWPKVDITRSTSVAKLY